MNFKYWLLIFSVLIFDLVRKTNSAGNILPTRYPVVSTLEKNVRALYLIYFKVSTSLTSTEQ